MVIGVVIGRRSTGGEQLAAKDIQRADGRQGTRNPVRRIHPARGELDVESAVQIGREENHG